MKTSTRCIVHAVLACVLFSPVIAAAQQASDAAPKMSAEQQAMMAAWQKAATPGPQHAQLAEQFVGSWDTRQTMWMDPSAPPMTETGKSVDTAVLGGRQVRSEFSSQFMGQPFHGIGLTGYDNISGKYTSLWIDDMSTSVMMTTGDYDPATRTYTFRGDMADPMKPGTMTPFRQTFRFVDADHHVMELHEQRDGKEIRTMMIEFSRAK